MCFFNLLEGFHDCASLSLPGTGQRKGGIFRAANEQIEKMHFSPFSVGNGWPLQTPIEGAWTEDCALPSAVPRLPPTTRPRPCSSSVFTPKQMAEAEDYYYRGRLEIIVTWSWRMRMTRLARPPLLFSFVGPLLLREDTRSGLISEDIFRLAAQHMGQH